MEENRSEFRMQPPSVPVFASVQRHNMYQLFLSECVSFLWPQSMTKLGFTEVCFPKAIFFGYDPHRNNGRFSRKSETFPSYAHRQETHATSFLGGMHFDYRSHWYVCVCAHTRQEWRTQCLTFPRVSKRLLDRPIGQTSAARKLDDVDPVAKNLRHRTTSPTGWSNSTCRPERFRNMQRLRKLMPETNKRWLEIPNPSRISHWSVACMLSLLRLLPVLGRWITCTISGVPVWSFVLLSPASRLFLLSVDSFT